MYRSGSASRSSRAIPTMNEQVRHRYPDYETVMAMRHVFGRWPEPAAYSEQNRTIVRSVQGHAVCVSRFQMMGKICILVVCLLFAGATAVEAGAISLQWDPNAETDVAGYRLSYGTSPGSTTTRVNVGRRTAWTVTNLVAGQRYFFSVQAYDGTGLLSPPSLEVNGVAPATPAASRRHDFDGDARADLVLYDPATGQWRVKHSSTAFTTSTTSQWGVSTDVPVPGDYDGDRRTDFAVYRPSNGVWYVYYATGTWVPYQWGMSTDIPVPSDYNGDGRTDLAIYRPSTGEWFIYYLSSGTWFRAQWGSAGDQPVTGDYDGDGRSDFAVWRQATGQWLVFYSGSSTWEAIVWGGIGDRPIAGDYDGDGQTDLGIWRPSTGQWATYNLRTRNSATYQWGVPTDVPVPGDYDGDGRTDLAVWRPATGEWFIYFVPSNTWIGYQWGTSANKPLPGGG
jgi:hypothetical protein